jgi:hypothetical protein
VSLSKGSTPPPPPLILHFKMRIVARALHGLKSDLSKMVAQTLVRVSRSLLWMRMKN